jgi:hypothetical protein
VVLAASLLAALALGAVRAGALEPPPPSPDVPDVPDHKISLWVNAFADDWSLVNATLDVGGGRVNTHGGVLLQVGPSVALTVLDQPVRIGCSGGYPIQRRFTGWSAQPVYGTGTVSGDGPQVSFDGLRDVSANVDHYLWLQFTDSTEFANPNPCA